MAGEAKVFRCAVYARKSTEHGLELEFNSLDAQRDACEAYIKSQASQGWRALPQHYDDPAYSGGNLDRPALKKLLADIEARRIDVVVVYKIDRLTRSLADFAKLVEAFDARSISFVAVTQQFNTTTSMGRLTLNILLSFAQFERELSSERVRDKIAASRRKGKWTGGTVPLGYAAREKKLVINKAEAETVQTIFQLYLKLKSFSKLVAELDRRGIVTKRRSTKVAKYQGGITFTYGPLAYFLKNRVYLGEIHHDGKWFEAEHEAIVDRATFDRVQQLLATKSNGRKAKRSESGALLLGKLYDDRGNRMSPSFSSKNGVRYRFYVSSALLRGQKATAGSIGRVPAAEIESAVLAALKTHQGRTESDSGPDLIKMLERVLVARDRLLVTISGPGGPTDVNGTRAQIRIAWSQKTRDSATAMDNEDAQETILKSLKDIIRLSGLDPAEFVGDWQSNMLAVQTWLASGDLEKVILEIFDPKTDELIFRWDVEIAYGWSGGDGSFWTDTEQLKYAIRKAGLVPSEARYYFLLRAKPGRPDVVGWGKGSFRSTDGMVRQSLGTTIEHSGLGASASYLRRA